MATATWPMPTPEMCDVVENVATYATSEFEDRVLTPLKELAEQAGIADVVDFELGQAGLPQQSRGRPLTDEQAGRIWRCVENLAQTARWLAKDAREARNLLVELTEPERHGDVSDKEFAAYRQRMQAWFEERAAAYGEEGRGDA